MMYQELMVGKDPFFAAVGKPTAFPQHRHTEIELSYCIEGSFTISVEKTVYTVRTGDLVVVTPMAAHELLSCGHDSGRRMTIVVGPALLGERFNMFATACPRSTMFHLRDGADKTAAELEGVLLETAGLLSDPRMFSDLMVKGNVFRLSGLLLRLLSQRDGSDGRNTVLRDAEKIERALELIHEHFQEKLDIESVSRHCGYGKSNFCKIFKSIVGDTFHNVLNTYRVQIACMHLENGDTPIEELAFRVGFADVKSFCRVFKKVTGKTARDYRKNAGRMEKTDIVRPN